MRNMDLSLLAAEADCFAKTIFPMLNNGLRMEYERLYAIGEGALRILKLPEAVNWFEIAIREKKLTSRIVEEIQSVGAVAFFYMEKNQEDCPNRIPLVDAGRFCASP